MTSWPLFWAIIVKVYVWILLMGRFRLKDLSVDEMVGTWCFDCLSGSPGLTCWVSFAPVFRGFFYCWDHIFALSPCDIFWFICSRRWCIDKLGVFHANQISKCLDPYLNYGRGWRCETGLSPLPQVKVFTACSKAVLLLWIFYVILSCVCYAFVCVCFYVPCGHLFGKGWPLGSRLWCLTVSLSLSHWYPGSGLVLDCIDPWSCTLTHFKIYHRYSNCHLKVYH